MNLRPVGMTDLRSPREIVDTLSYYSVKNILVKCYAIAIIVYNVVYTTFRPKGNNNSRSKYIFEINTI